MNRHPRLLTALVIVGSVVALAGGAASAGVPNAEITYDPNPVTAGSSTTASGTCPSSADHAELSFEVAASGGGVLLVTASIVVPPGGVFSGDVPIPAGAITQTLDSVGGFCLDTELGLTLALLAGTLGITEQVPPTEPTTTTTTTEAPTTTVAPTTTAVTVPTTTAAPSPTTTLVVTLPATGNSSGSAAAIAAAALLAGGALILVTRRRSADQS